MKAMLGNKKGLSRRYPAQLIVPIADALAVVVGALMAHWWRFGVIELPERFTLVVIIVSLLVVVLNSMLGGYSRWRVTSNITLLGRLLLVWFLVGLSVAAIIYFAHVAHYYSRLWLGGTLLLSFIIAAGIVGLVGAREKTPFEA